MEVRLRPWRDDDLEELVRHINNFNVVRFLSDVVPHPYSREDGERYLAMVKSETPQRTFAIEADGRPVGSIGLIPGEEIYRKNAEIGYWLAEPYWGKGITPRAVKQIVEYGFRTFDIDRIYARVFAPNAASQRVLQKAGFRLEAFLRGTLYKRGEFADEMIYAVRRDRSVC